MSEIIKNYDIKNSIVGRYKILDCNDKAYLVDCSSNKLGWMFPVLNWMFPQKAYTIENNETINKLKQKETKNSKIAISGILGGGIGSYIAVKLRNTIENFNIEMSSSILWIFLIFVTVIIVCISIKNNISSSKKVYSILKDGNYMETKFRITIDERGLRIKYILRMLFAYIFCVLFDLVGVILFLKYGNVIMLLAHIIFFSVLVFCRFTVKLPENYSCEISDYL